MSEAFAWLSAQNHYIYCLGWLIVAAVVTAAASYRAPNRRNR